MKQATAVLLIPSLKASKQAKNLSQLRYSFRKVIKKIPAYFKKNRYFTTLWKKSSIKRMS